MKCENCGKNEVTFVYRSSINGKTEEAHLCSGCAEKLGYTQKISTHTRRMQDFFGASMLGGGFFDDFFTPMPGLMGRMSRMLENPFDDFFTDMPALGTPAGQVQEEKKQDGLVEEEEQGRFARMRHMNALRMEMKKAVHQENFERAAELRDEIRKLEAGQKDGKESA